MSYVINEIPLSPTPQKFTISLAGVQYQADVVWNSYSNNWNLSLANSLGVPVLSSIPLVTGSDLLQQFDYLLLGGALITQSDSDLTKNPTLKGLGITEHLYFVT